MVLCNRCPTRIRSSLRFFASKSAGTAKKPRNKYSSTVLLPTTKFPQRINDGQARVDLDESIRTACQFDNLYAWLQKNRASRPEYILHDGPPYANGEVHIGHAVNKILKDITNRYKILKGFRPNYQPGWDCHGLPIELKALERLGTTSAKDQPNLVRETAKIIVKESFDKQQAAFRRWGVVADWNKDFYMTSTPAYEAKQIELFWRLYENGWVYRDYKPVYWSPSSQTSLAEAELEYNDKHKSVAVFSRFQMLQVPEHLRNQLSLDHQKLDWFAVIWTTTPWSIPGNQAIAFHSEVQYALVWVESQIWVMAENVIPDLEKLTGLTMKKLARFPGKDLQSATYSHPFETTRECRFLPADYVGADKGSGLVHTAPTHGHDDFLVGLKHGLDMATCLVDEDGKFTKDAGSRLFGKEVLGEGTREVIGYLTSNRLLIHCNDAFVHSYPYDWRSKKPVILRASEQWFIDVEQVKSIALEALEKVQVIPDSGKDYMKSQLEKRPYWCISRQRIWGVPIPVFYSANRQPLLNKVSIEHVKNLISQQGADIWWRAPDNLMLPENVRQSFGVAPNDLITKGTDIFDIWFESGTSWAVVLGEDKTADLCIEGHDQYTAWFQTSLITSATLRKTAPFKRLLVHGFAVDEEGKKMSKSIGNVVHPDSVTSQQGADVLRWWVAQYGIGSSSIPFGRTIVETLKENSMKIRNTLRFLLGCLDGFSTATQSVPYQDLLLTDRYMLHLTRNFLSSIDTLYADMHYNKVAMNIVVFLNSVVSSWYCTVIKDRMYCGSKSSLERRSAQTVVAKLLNSLLLCMGPIAPYVVEEVFQHVKQDAELYSFFQREWTLPDVASDDWAHMDGIFSPVLHVRDHFNQSFASQNLSKLRVDLLLDNSLMTKFEMLCAEGDHRGCSELCSLLGVSRVVLHKLAADVSLPGGVEQFDGTVVANDDANTTVYKFSVSSCEEKQCGRCRKFVIEETGNELCSRCLNVIGENWSV